MLVVVGVMVAVVVVAVVVVAVVLWLHCAVCLVVRREKGREEKNLHEKKAYHDVAQSLPRC